jgi:hypothetical protein
MTSSECRDPPAAKISSVPIAAWPGLYTRTSARIRMRRESSRSLMKRAIPLRIQKKGTSMTDLVITGNRQENLAIHRRDRQLGEAAPREEHLLETRGLPVTIMVKGPRGKKW